MEMDAYLQNVPAPVQVLCVICEPVQVEERFNSFRS